MSKSKCTKHTMLGPLLEVEMSKKCTPLWREAHFEVKMYKTHHVRATFGRSELVSRGRRKGLYTFSQVSKTWGVLWHFQLQPPLHHTTLQYTTLHSTTLHYITLPSTTLHSITLRYNPLHSTTLHSITLHYIPLHYTTFHYITPTTTTTTSSTAQGGDGSFKNRKPKTQRLWFRDWITHTPTP